MKKMYVYILYTCISLLVLPCYQTHWSLFATPPVKGAAPAAPAPAAPVREPLSRRALTARAGNEEVFPVASNKTPVVLSRLEE